MALTDDQKALLRLLAIREDGYADIAALKGLSVDQVRAEVRAALEELGAGARAASPEPPAEPAPPPPPTAGPTMAGEPAGEGAARARPRAPRSQRSVAPVERRRLLALAAGALGIVAAALALVAVLGGGSGSTPASEAVADSEATAGQGAQLTQATLKPPGGGDAGGRAVFGRVGQEEVALQVTAQNLEPSRQGQSYTVWLYRSPKLSLRVGSVKVPENGRLGARFPIPAELLAYVASGAFSQIAISRTSDSAYGAEVKRARKTKTLPPYSGETVLRGKIKGPIVKR